MDDIHVTVFVILLVLGGKETQLCVVEIVLLSSQRTLIICILVVLNDIRPILSYAKTYYG